MKLTTKGRYAVTAMLDLSLHGREAPVSLAEISQRQGISLSHGAIVCKAAQQDLVLSVRGAWRGYKLGRPEDRIFIAEVVDAVSESIDTTRCQHKETVRRVKPA